MITACLFSPLLPAWTEKYPLSRCIPVYCLFFALSPLNLKETSRYADKAVAICCCHRNESFYGSAIKNENCSQNNLMLILGSKLKEYSLLWPLGFERDFS
jgi:hypothetical protein